MTKRGLPIEQRFWAKVDTSGNCWEWTAGHYPKGYGQFWDGKRLVRAHRFSWELHIGAIPDGLFVLHDCDNPPCVRPDHLFLGTPADNTSDCIAKGRFVFNPRDAALWDAVGTLFYDGLAKKAIARHLDITPASVRYIIQAQGLSRQHAAVSFERGGRRRNHELWSQVAALFASGAPKRQIARHLGIDPAGVRYILRQQGAA